MNKKLIAMFLTSASFFGVGNINAEENEAPPLSEIHKKQINELYEKVLELKINLDYCVNNVKYKKLAEILRNPSEKVEISQRRMAKIAKAYKIPEPKMEFSEKEPSEAQCVSAIESLHKMMGERYSIIDEIYWVYKGVPPLSKEDRKHLTDMFQKNLDLNTVDMGYCIEQYPKVEARVEKLHTIPTVIQEERLREVYEFTELNELDNDKVDHNPSETQCLAALEKAEALLKQYTPLIERIYNALPADQKEEKEAPTDWKKEMQEIYDEQLETD